jgi:hypothetical protein
MTLCTGGGKLIARREGLWGPINRSAECPSCHAWVVCVPAEGRMRLVAHQYPPY